MTEREDEKAEKSHAKNMEAASSGNKREIKETKQPGRSPDLKFIISVTKR